MRQLVDMSLQVIGKWGMSMSVYKVQDVFEADVYILNACGY